MKGLLVKYLGYHVAGVYGKGWRSGVACLTADVCETLKNVMGYLMDPIDECFMHVTYTKYIKNTYRSRKYL